MQKIKEHLVQEASDLAQKVFNRLYIKERGTKRWESSCYAGRSRIPKTGKTGQKSNFCHIFDVCIPFFPMV